MDRLPGRRLHTRVCDAVAVVQYRGFAWRILPRPTPNPSGGQAPELHFPFPTPRLSPGIGLRGRLCWGSLGLVGLAGEGRRCYFWGEGCIMGRLGADGRPPGNRTLNLRIKSPLLYH